MNIKEMIKVMQHFANGGLVEFTELGTNEWSIANIPCWSWCDYDYRIREQKVVTIEKWLLKDDEDNYYVVQSSNIDKFNDDNKVKLLETYEVEL